MILLQFVQQHDGNLTSVLDALPCDLPDWLKVESILQPCFPITVLIPLFQPLRELSHTVTLPGKLDGLLHQPDDTEILQINRVGKQPRIFDNRRAVWGLVQ